jgi:hypothetical protein
VCSRPQREIIADVRARIGAAAVASLALLVAVSGASGAPAAKGSSAKITRVTITGTERNPVITVHGQHLGTRPHPNPTYHPLGHPPLCPPNPTEPQSAYGFDYGTKLFLVDSTQQPNWSGGRYRPKLGELDCVGVVVLSFSQAKVVFRFDAAYREPLENHPDRSYHLLENDAFTVGVNGAHFSGRVHYR